jgi:hypothetical protein
MKEEIRIFVENKQHGFNSDDVAECNDFPTLCDWSVKNYHTLKSIRIQLMEFEGEDKKSRSRKLKAVELVECLQHFIDTKIKLMMFDRSKKGLLDYIF